MLDILIIGGGLAGLVSANHLSQAGLKVMVIEKNAFPKHKVCGEYISNEVLGYLEYLGINPFELGATSLKNFTLSTSKGKTVSAQLPLGGFGISRYTLDHFLYQKAVENGCLAKQATVVKSHFKGNGFEVETMDGQMYEAKFVIGAYGKRSNMDLKLDRPFIKQEAPFLGVKSHYKGDFPEDVVALHNFRGGYCGVSKVEKDFINICYLADFETFKKYKNLEDYQAEVICKNPHLKEILNSVEMTFPKPLTISQVSFLPKRQVESHIFMSGDAAGMIHPLCGNGMGMAIHSAKMLSELLITFFEGKKTKRGELENLYVDKWKHTFRNRLLAGRFFNVFFRKDRLFEKAMNVLPMFPPLLPFFIKQTHGRELLEARSGR